MRFTHYGEGYPVTIMHIGYIVNKLFHNDIKPANIYIYIYIYIYILL